MTEFEEGRIGKAIAHFDLALRILTENGLVDTEDYASLLHNKGDAFFCIDEIDFALTCYDDALVAYKKSLGKDHIKISVVLERIASCIVRSRDHEEAFELYEEAFSVRKQHGNAADLGTAKIQFGMGIVCCEMGHFNKSLDFYEESLKIRQSLLGNDNVEVAEILNNIGSVFARNQEYQRALQPWQDAIEMYKRSGLTDDHPKVACTLGNMEISKNLVSLTQQKGLRSDVRKICSY